MKQFWLLEVWNLIFRILKSQYLIKVVLNFKEALYFLALASEYLVSGREFLLYD